MRHIDYLEALKAIRTCVEKHRYRVGVFTQTMKDAQIAYDDMVAAVRGDEEESNAVEQSATSQREKRIQFKNGSYIKILPAHENARGYKFNTVLYCDGIDRKILDTVVRNTEFKYREENNCE